MARTCVISFTSGKPPASRGCPPPAPSLPLHVSRDASSKQPLVAAAVRSSPPTASPMHFKFLLLAVLALLASQAAADYTVTGMYQLVLSPLFPYLPLYYSRSHAYFPGIFQCYFRTVSRIECIWRAVLIYAVCGRHRCHFLPAAQVRASYSIDASMGAGA